MILIEYHWYMYVYISERVKYLLQLRLFYLYIPELVSPFLSFRCHPLLMGPYNREHVYWLHGRSIQRTSCKCAWCCEIKSTLYLTLSSYRQSFQKWTSLRKVALPVTLKLLDFNHDQTPLPICSTKYYFISICTFLITLLRWPICIILKLFLCYFKTHTFFFTLVKSIITTNTSISLLAKERKKNHILSNE